MQEKQRLSAMMEDGIALRRHLATAMAPLIFQAIDLCEAALRGNGKLFFAVMAVVPPMRSIWLPSC